MKKIIAALALCFSAQAITAHAEENNVPIDFFSGNHFEFQKNREQWKPRVQSALELIENEASSKEEGIKRSDKVWLVAFGTFLVAGLVGSVVMSQENARGGDGSICCRSEPYVHGRRPTMGDPDDDENP